MLSDALISGPPRLLVRLPDNFHITTPDRLYGAAERLIAAESLSFVEEILIQSAPRIVHVLAPSQHVKVKTFLQRAHDIVRELQVGLVTGRQVSLARERFSFLESKVCC